MLIQIKSCMRCGADDTPIQGAALPSRGGMWVGWFCAPCVAQVTAEERERQAGEETDDAS